jgi:methylamine dehydrogenase heavy chain
VSAIAVFTVAACIAVPAQAAPVALPQLPPNVTLPVKPPGAHWFWVGDYQGGNYGRSVLNDADTATILGMIDTGWEGGRLLWSDKEIYNAAMFMSRGLRGQRTDVVTTFDPRTLKPLREIVVPPKTIRGFQDMNHFSLTDDKRFMLLQLMSPASSIGVVDLPANKYVGEIETAGCINAIPAGNRRLFAMCGDGSLLAVSLNEEDKEASRKRFPKFFDPDSDSLHESGVRSGNTWYFVSHLGRIHAVDVSGMDFKAIAEWNVSEKEGDNTWIPGQPMQNLAVHHRQQRLYVLVYPSDLKPKLNGTDIHRRPGTEVWVYDLKTQRRLQRIPLKNLVAQSQ